MTGCESDYVSSIRLDHVILAVTDLPSAAADLYDRTGLAAVPGGRHLGRGTANLLVPLGNAYLELAAVVDPAEAATDPFGQWIGAAATATGAFAGWCVSSEDLDADAGRRGLTPEDWTREASDGSLSRWRTAGLANAIAEPWRPFLIGWEVPPEARPGRRSAPHRNPPLALDVLTIAGPARELAEWLDHSALPVTVLDSESGPGVKRVGINTTAGPVELARP